MTKEQLFIELEKRTACAPGVDLVKTIDGDHAAVVAAVCKVQPGWVLWWANKVGVSKEKLMAVATDAALLLTSDLSDKGHPAPDKENYLTEKAVAYLHESNRDTKHVADVVNCVYNADQSKLQALTDIVNKHISIEDIEAAIAEAK
jgi:hypothetical protein